MLVTLQFGGVPCFHFSLIPSAGLLNSPCAKLEHPSVRPSGPRFWVSCAPPPARAGQTSYDSGFGRVAHSSSLPAGLLIPTTPLYPMPVRASPKPLTLKHSLGCRVVGRFSADAGRAGSPGLSASVRDLRKQNRENLGGLDLLTHVSPDKFFHLKIACVCAYVCEQKYTINTGSPQRYCEFGSRPSQ